MRFFRYYFLPAAAGLIVLLFTFYAYTHTLHSVASRKEKLFELRTREAGSAIQNRIIEYTQILKSAQAFWISSDTVTRSMWKKYYTVIDVNENYPGIQGLAYAPYIPAEKIDSFVNTVRREGFPSYTINPPGLRNHYVPILYIEPFEGRNLRAFGFDMYSESARRNAMDLAAEKGAPAITSKVTLIQETASGVQPGFLLYVPLYYHNQVSPQNLKGFLYAPFRVHDLMNAILAEKFTDLDIELYDDTIPSIVSLIYNKNGPMNYGEPLERDQLGKRTTMRVLNHTWTLYFTSGSDFGPAADRQQPLIIFAGGTVISLLLFFAVGALANTNRRATHLADEMTQRYRESEERMENIIRNAPDAVIVIDRQSRVLQWNPKAQKLFGYSPDEVTGKRLTELIIPERYREAHLNGMKRYISTGEAHIINRTVEMTAIDRNNNEVPVEISVSSGLFGKEQVFIAFIADISERKRTEAELIRKSVDLERSRELERKKDEFLGVASHELKTPLTSAKAYVQLLERQLSEEQCSTLAHQYILKANNYIDKLNRLIGDLLDATKIQSGKLQLEVNEFPIDSFVRECVENIQYVNDTHKLHLHGKTDLYIKGDKQRLEQVIVNLLTNAIKYSPNSDRVDVTIERTGSEVKVGVRDYGIGIEEHNLPKMFSRFYRVEKDSSQYQGLGLGLYISRQIIERHNGRMWVESKKGEGSVFYFTLPVQHSIK